ncbi:putative xyloglucan endotransglucosylase/hydrolase protein 25 [Triticum urartu]|uniref:Xyloglucan endotransglucosylase/hydrolase n=1 Tax=Triticum urartu TaxID=4572 RepID=M7ZJR7_TRIUA|nr:putative xyloglucan endotransglucosylase/hydrolase protein 25 [Triticum urartu]
MARMAVSVLAILLASCALAAASFDQEFDVTWGDGRGKILNNGQLLTLGLDKVSGSGFQSKHEYLYGKIDMQLKLVPGNSAGTVTAYYLSSQGPTHDEIDFEFLGISAGGGASGSSSSASGSIPPTTSTPTPFSGTQSTSCIFMVDDMPIRDFRNLEGKGIAFPKNQPMRLYSSLWNADDWATQGGRVKTDWSHAPFSASYRGFKADACVMTAGGAAAGDWYNQELDLTRQERMRWVQSNYMIYNYCTDPKRVATGVPAECSM